MTRDEYNAKVQELQAMWGDMARIRPSHGVSGKIEAAYFEVYWDGHWRTLGVQRYPFTPETSYRWDELEERHLRGSFAGALIHS